MKFIKNFIAQQDNACDKMAEYVNALLSTGKCHLDIPPDCFVWSGTKEELQEFTKNFWKKYPNK